MFTITMPRGDIRTVPFTVRDRAGVVSTIPFDEIYFTVKKSYTDRQYLFQKRLSDGTIEAGEEPGTYQFILEASDTDSLQIRDYVCDIELIYGNELKETTVGKLTLTNEVTFAENEV